MNVNAPIRSIDLAHVAPFRLAMLDVSPPTCEVSWAGGRETLQPRVMQVLIALSERRGAVVSHDDLINACWEGRIVGEDAIQRCIARLRDLARRTEAFTIETLPRIGYRLDAAAGAEPVTPAPASRWRRPRLWIAVGLLAISALVAGVGLQAWRASDASLRVQVAALQAIGGKDSPIFARTLQGDIVDVLNQSGVQMTGAGQSALLGWVQKPSLVLRGSVAQTGRQLKVHLTLEDVASGLTLWSERFERDVAASGALADAVAAAAAETIYTLLEFDLQKGLHPDPEILALHIRGSALVRSPQFLQEGSPLEIYEQIVARAPKIAGGHAMLAIALANEARRAPPPARPALVARSRAAAQAAIRIDPAAAGAAYDALFLETRILRPYNVIEAEDRILEGLRNAPGFPYLSMRECRFLVDVGRARDAMPHCQRALALRPLAGPIGYSYARALNVAGAEQLAQKAIERAARYNPDHDSTRWTLLLLAAFDGSAERAGTLLHDPATQPANMSPQEFATLDKYIAARRSGRPADRDAAVEAMRTTDAGQMRPDFAVMAFSSLGYLDDAFAVLRRPDMDVVIFSAGSAFLFRPVTAPLRADPRFWEFAARLGLAQYWTARGKWPDMCGQEIPLAQCKSNAAKALSRTR